MAMNDLQERFGSLSRLRAPDLWRHIQERDPGGLPQERRRSTRPLIATMALLLALGGLALVVWAFAASGPRPGPASTPSSLIPSPLTGHVATTIDVGPYGQTNSVLAAADQVWVTAYGVAQEEGAFMLRVDPATDRVVGRTSLLGGPGWETGGGGLTFGDGSLWVAGGGHGPSGGTEGVLQRIDPATGDVQATTWMGGRTGADVAVDQGSVWVALFRDPDSAQVVRVDPGTNAIVNRIPLESDYVRRIMVARGFVVVEEKVWPGGEGPITLLQTIDPATNQVVATVREDGALAEAEVTVWNGELWAASREGFIRLDPTTLEPVGAPVPGGENLCCMVLVPGGDGIWTIDSNRELLRFDPRAGAVQDVAHVPGSPIALAPGDGSVWVLDYDGRLSRVALSE
jgi:hypothetical protein